MRLVFPNPIGTALFAGLLLGGLAVAGAQQPSDQSAPPQSAPQTDQQAPQTALPADQQPAPPADQQPAAQTVSPADNTPADNTKLNERDRNPNEPTADRQKDKRSDREITQQVRKAIVKDKSLSTYAHNVKVITQNGMVTLKGPVRSEEEKKAIEAKAAEVAGQDKVTNQLDVKSKD
jgi:hyperosmotically inducible protein